MLFAVFLFIAYLMLYALTHLEHAESWTTSGGSTPAQAGQ
jgi:hypothetical protein